MGRGVVGRPVALQERWNRGDLALPDWGVSPDSETVGSSSQSVIATVTTHATPHSKGAWVELIAATSAAWDGIDFVMGAVSASTLDTSTLLDVGTGAAAAEVVIIPEFDVGFGVYTATTSPRPSLVVPVRIPAGSRVAVRVQGAQSSTGYSVYLTGFMKSPVKSSPSSLVSIGTSTGSSAGTTLTAPGSTHTKSAWTQITASTATPYQAIVCCIGMPAGTTAQVSAYGLVDLGVGAAGSEVVIASNIPIRTSSSEYIVGTRYRTINRHVPAGTRIAVRYQSASTTSVVAASVIGIPY